MAENPDESVTTAVRAVVEAGIEKRLLRREDYDVNVENIRRGFYYARSHENDDSTHGNSHLTMEKEQILLGFIEGLARAGRDMTKSAIKLLAHDLFDGEFGNTWYYIYFDDKLPADCLSRWDAFSKRNSSLLNLSQTKSTTKNRTKPLTLEDALLFREFWQEHMKSTY